MKLLAAAFTLAAALAGAASAQPVAGTFGPYKAVMEMDTRLPAHTVYRPADLASVKGKLPIVAFGNGGCLTIGNMFDTFLGEVASRGYLVTTGGEIDPNWKGFPAMPPGGGPPAGPMPVMKQDKTDQMFAAIDWAIAENGRQGSPYYGRIDTSRIAVMGQSCGGLQAIAAGGDPRVTTVVVLNSGIIRGGIPNPDGTTRTRSYLPATEADLAKLHTPVAYLIGGPKDQAYRGAEADFTAINGVPLFNANLDVGHGGTWREPGGGAMGKVAIAWLDWRLKDFDHAKGVFTGPDCAVCKDSKWTVKRKNMD